MLDVLDVFVVVWYKSWGFSSTDLDCRQSLAALEYLEQTHGGKHIFAAYIFLTDFVELKQKKKDVHMQGGGFYCYLVMWVGFLDVLV